MSQIPKDPVMCMSFLNMKLRDRYRDLDELCDDLEEDREMLLKRLAEAGFEYDAEQKRFR